MSIKLSLGVLAVLVVAAAAPRAVHAQPSDPWDGNWHYTVTPYAWLPGIRASMRFQTPDASVASKSTGNIWDNLSGAFELEGEARKGRWGVYADVDWVDFTGGQGRMTAIGRNGTIAQFDGHWGMQGAMANVAGMYNLSHGQAGFIDLLFGARYVWIKGNVRWTAAATGNLIDFAASGRHSRSADFINPVVGLRGRWSPFRGHVYFPFHVDYGRGGNTSSAQASAGVGYAFHWGDAAVSWRYLRLTQDGASALLRSATLTGPSVQLSWHF